MVNRVSKVSNSYSPCVTEQSVVQKWQANTVELKAESSLDRSRPPFFVPKDLREEGLVSLIEQLKKLDSQRPDPGDEGRFEEAIVAAVPHHFSFQRS
jgi:hypothetical protein